MTNKTKASAQEAIRASLSRKVSRSAWTFFSNARTDFVLNDVRERVPELRMIPRGHDLDDVLDRLDESRFDFGRHSTGVKACENVLDTQEFRRDELYGQSCHLFSFVRDDALPPETPDICVANGIATFEREGGKGEIECEPNVKVGKDHRDHWNGCIFNEVLPRHDL